MKRHKANQEWENYRAALVATVVANVHRDPKKRAFKVEDFMPKAKATVKAKKLDADQVVDMLRVLNAASKGREVVKNGN